MQNPGKLLAALTILIVIMLVVLHFLNPGPPNNSPAPISIAPTNHSTSPQFVFHPQKTPAPEEQPELDMAGNPKISREKVEEWLAKHNRDAASLLAAFHALEDTNYLNEAATNFPNNPQVEWTILARNAFPEDRRKWLDLFKASSPSNSLANYFSAEDYFKNGNPDAAVQELLAAKSKSQFGDYIMESELDGEALNQFAGKTQLDSDRLALSHAATDMMTEDATLKRLAQGVGDLQKQELAAGDTASLQNLAEVGANLRDQLTSGDSGKYIINQLVGNSIEVIALQTLDPNTACDFLDGETPSQKLQEFKQQKASAGELLGNFNAIYPSLTEAEQNNYFERTKIYGETAAMQWMVQQHPPNPSQNAR